MGGSEQNLPLGCIRPNGTNLQEKSMQHGSSIHCAHACTARRPCTVLQCGQHTGLSASDCPDGGEQQEAGKCSDTQSSAEQRTVRRAPCCSRWLSFKPPASALRQER